MHPNHITLQPGSLTAELSLIQAKDEILERIHKFAGQNACTIVVDSAIQGPFIEALQKHYPLQIPGQGEALKTQEQLFNLLQSWENLGLDKSSKVIAIGGGAISDLTGLASALYMRGITYATIPTTLLSMVDASIGGKTGINTASGKNIIGVMHHPSAIFICPAFLKTLSPRSFNSGMAEVIKCSLWDQPLWETLKGKTLQSSSPELENIIKQTSQIKLEIIEQDYEDKQGIRAQLNLGHTFAHAIESVTHYQMYLHGEAVAIGLVLACEYAVQKHDLNPSKLSELKSLLERHALPTRLKTPISSQKLIEAMRKDKKNKSGNIHLVLPSKNNTCFIDNNIDLKCLQNIWKNHAAT